MIIQPKGISINHHLHPDKQTSTQQMNHILNVKLRQHTLSAVTQPCLDVWASYFDWSNNTVLVYKHLFYIQEYSTLVPVAFSRVTDLIYLVI